ncbi:MAG: 1-deoxy-D-xylulose-5-phosphate reductoisomerase, partial [Muribaculaceae bacterium]|nr:1-deoxy-D-xylulose-5-phosphate reductoisomerase [Muribaculaceae bacterium]
MEARKRIAILGSTGSIGCQTLDVIAEHPDKFEATVLIAGTRVDKLIEQALTCKPALAIIADESRYTTLHEALAPAGIATAAGQEAINAAMGADNVDTVVTATVGYSGLAPTIAAIKAGKDIALANKETLVVAGELITQLLKTSSSKVIPVDSEHSAIYQCLVGEDPQTVRRLIITASGGPFRTRTVKELETVTVHDALKHPNWAMGAKITIDSASMINKAFEVIEAHWLFDVPSEKISVAVHPQSIVHSMIEFHDGAIKAQLGQPDMRLPIRYALGDANRLSTVTPGLTISQYANLTYEEPDTVKFQGLSLAWHALEKMGNTACTINAANEVAVAAFLHEQIKFLDIYRIIMDTLKQIEYIPAPSLDDYV